MNSATCQGINAYSLQEAMRTCIADYLQGEFAQRDGMVRNLDRWTRRQIMEENLAKLGLVMASDQPSEACYRDLIREISSEAEMGVFLACRESDEEHLRRVLDEPGVSGDLHRELPRIAPVLFPDELAHSSDDMNLVRVTVRACHDRAYVDATVSQIIMSYLVDDAQSVLDMVHAMRALQYAFHEELVRRTCDLPSLLGEHEGRELMIMVSDLERRAGSYEARVEAIRSAAEPPGQGAVGAMLCP